MQSKFVRSGVIGALTAVIVGLMPALPAFAALNGTASITSSRDLFAGRQSDITFRFNNPSTATVGLVGETQPTMNRVQIVPAPGFAISCPATSPGSWTCFTTSKGIVRYSHPQGGGIAPGGNQSFDVVANAGRPGNDQTRTWQVQMSPDHGDSFVDPDATTPGTLDTTIRILQVVSVAIAGPAGAVDNTVTSGQNNTLVDVTVINGGSAAKETTATLTSPGNDTVRTQPGPQPVPAYNGTSDGSATFRFGVNFGSTGTRQLTGDASALGADAFEGKSAPITIQTPVDLTYVIGSLTPLASRSGASQTFELRFNKTGDPTGGSLGGSLQFTRNDGTRSFSAPLSSSADLPAGPGPVTLRFGPVTIPGTLEGALSGDPLNPDNYDGDYNLSATITGTDGNGAAVNLTKSISDIFAIDNLVPDVAPLLQAPNRVAKAGAVRATNNADPNQPYSARNGQTLQIRGDIFKAGGSSQLDTVAQVVKCEIRVFNAEGVQVANFVQPRTNCREDGTGHLTGSATIPDFQTTAGTALVYVEVADRVPGNVGFDTSPPIVVDNVRPTFGTGRTGCRGLTAAECAGGATKTIVVPTSEPVTGTYLGAEFTCAGNVVTNASFNGNATTYGDRVILTLGQEISEDSEPICRYVLAAPANPAPLDGPTNAFLSPIDLTIIDDIAPDLPSILTVNGNTPYTDDEMFYTNDSTPEVEIGGLDAQYIGIVARETNGTDGYQFGSDAELCRFSASGDTGTCTTADLGGDSPRDATTGDHIGFVLYGASIDRGGNISFDKEGVQVGNGTPFDLVLDRVAPRSTTALVNATARTIAVSFDEKLDSSGDQAAPDPAARGRNSAQDWTIRVTTANSESRLIAPVAVANDGYARKTLAIAANQPDWTGSTVNSIEYSVELSDGDPPRRHQDRAGNDLLDFPPGPRPTIT